MQFICRLVLFLNLLFDFLFVEQPFSKVLDQLRVLLLYGFKLLCFLEQQMVFVSQFFDFIVFGSGKVQPFSFDLFQLGFVIEFNVVEF